MTRSPRSALRWWSVSALFGLLGAVVSPTTAVAAHDPVPPGTHDGVRIVDLGVAAAEPSGVGAEAVATHISENTVVYGYVAGVQPSRAFRWHDGAVTWLDRLGHEWSRVVEVNARGDAVGVVATTPTDNSLETTRAVMWGRDGGVVPLGPVEGHSAPADVNDRGVVAGVVGGDDWPATEHAVIWRRTGQMVRLENPSGGASRAVALNNRGEVAGTVTDEHGNPTAARWDWHGRVSVFEPPDFDVGLSVAFDIDRRGTVLVWTVPLDDEPVERWYLWRRGRVTEVPVQFQRTAEPTTPLLGPRGAIYGARAIAPGVVLAGRAVRADSEGVTELGVLGGGESVVTAVNKWGHAVGRATLAESAPGGIVMVRAVLFRDDRVVDLGTLPGGQVSFARDINRRGQVVGSSWDGGADGRSHAVMWLTGSRP